MSSSLSTPTIINDIHYLSKDGGEAHDDAGQGRLYVLVCVSDELLDAGKQLRHDHLLLHPLVQVQTEVLHLVSCRSSDLRLAVLQRLCHCNSVLLFCCVTMQPNSCYYLEKALESGDEVCLGDVLAHGGLELCELVRHHVPHPPALVLSALPQCGHH